MLWLAGAASWDSGTPALRPEMERVTELLTPEALLSQESLVQERGQWPQMLGGEEGKGGCPFSVCRLSPPGSGRAVSYLPAHSSHFLTSCWGKRDLGLPSACGHLSGLGEGGEGTCQSLVVEKDTPTGGSTETHLVRFPRCGKHRGGWWSPGRPSLPVFEMGFKLF